MRMSLILSPVALLLCMGDITHGSETQRLAYHLRHPQEQFCSADFVIHAKVLPNYTVEGDKHKIRVYELKILNIYKGSDLLINRTNEAQVKAYADAVELENGTEYLLTGKIRSEKLKLNLGSLVEQWATVTPAYLAGINGFYAQNCECHITPCFGQPCEPLKGCDVSLRLLREFYQGCEWRHSYCVKNALGSACSWHETAEYMDCLQTP